MRVLSFVIFLIATVQADLNCIVWDLILLPVGLFCHFKHDAYNAVENATIATVEKVAEDVKDVAVFEFEHHPLVLGYKWAETAITNGTTAANTIIKGAFSDQISVDIGFSKELANTAVQIYELLDWQDLAICLMVNTAKHILDGDGDDHSTLNSSASNGSGVNASLPNPATPTLYPTSASSANGGIIPVTTFGLSNSAGGVGGSFERVPPSSSGPVSVSKKKRLVVPSAADAKRIAGNCLNDKFKRISTPQVFNITDPNEKIGSTLFQLALFFVPIGAEEKVAGEIAEGGVRTLVDGFDLVVPGSEDAGRLYKQVGNKAEHFASEEEALAVKEQLKSEDWIEANCATCTAPAGVGVGKAKQKRARSLANPRLTPRALELLRRGNGLSLCCNPKGINTDSVVTTDAYGDDELMPYYDPTSWWGRRGIAESALSPAAELTTWTSSAVDKASILADLAKEQTAVLTWSSDVTGVTHSDDFFKLLRSVVDPAAKNAETETLQNYMGLRSFNGDKRLRSISSDFLQKTPPNQNGQLIRDFTDAALKQGRETAGDLKGLTEADAANLQGDVEYYWIPPSKGAIVNPDTRGVHIDNGIIMLGAADQPGLIVDNGVHALSRVPIKEDGWHIMKGSDWGKIPYDTAEATEHTVFGPEIVENGRVSIIVNIRPPFGGS